MNSVGEIYRKRFEGKLDERDRVWRDLCRNYFQRLILPSETVMDIGAGYCEFINNIAAKQKIAVDVNPDTQKFAGRDVLVICAAPQDIPAKFKNNVDVVFMSNFLEHLSSKDEVMEVLRVSKSLLKRGGRLIILQPNIDLVKEKYWDFIDHRIALNGKSVVEALKVIGFERVKFVKRFLPMTMESPFPKHPLLIKLYLALPPSFRPFAGQSLFVGHD